MKKISFVSLCVIVLLLLSFLSPCVGYGQSYKTFRSELEQIKERAKWRLGPFKIYPAIIFRNIGYDNNVYYQREEDEPVADFTATLSPQIKNYLIFQNHVIFSLTVNPEYVYYSEQKEERAWNNAFSPEVKFLFLNHFVISGEYTKSKRRRRPSSEFDVRANELREGYTGSLFYETGWKTSLGISASSVILSYEERSLPGEEIGLSRALNRSEKNAHFAFYYRLLTESDFFIQGGYTEYEFENPESRWRNSQSYQVYTGLHFPILGKIQGTLSLGYKKLVPRTGDKKGFSGIVGDTSLDFRLKRFNFRLNYNRNGHFSYWTNNVYFIEDRYGAGVSFYLTRFLRIDYNLHYGESRYPEPIQHQNPDGSFSEQKRKDIYLTHSAGIVFRIVKNTGLGVMVNYWRRESSFSFENRERFFAGGYITYEF